ncbi:MAG: hypothetical protein DCF31_17955 [Alphaproteobacteria bacterium]|nr:MAG: hypothetical protein DCF31_17955 [Alphaproteobacteria bacterium]
MPGEGRCIPGEGRCMPGEGRCMPGEGRCTLGDGRIADGAGRAAGAWRVAGPAPRCGIWRSPGAANATLANWLVASAVAQIRDTNFRMGHPFR